MKSCLFPMLLSYWHLPLSFHTSQNKPGAKPTDPEYTMRSALYLGIPVTHRDMHPKTHGLVRPVGFGHGQLPNKQSVTRPLLSHIAGKWYLSTAGSTVALRCLICSWDTIVMCTVETHNKKYPLIYTALDDKIDKERKGKARPRKVKSLHQCQSPLVAECGTELASLQSQSYPLGLSISSSPINSMA